MGIERFFSSIEENKITKGSNKDGFTTKLESKININHLFMDFNSVIYGTSANVLKLFNSGLWFLVTDKKNKFNEVVIKLQLQEEWSKQDNSKNKIQKWIEISNTHLDKIILDETVNYIYNFLNNCVIKEHIETFFIAIDGVPTKSKIVEQRKRRYMGTLISHIEDEIFYRHQNSLSKHRRIYEKYKIFWNKTKITPGTGFMNDLSKTLSSNDFIGEITTLCLKLKTYVFSGPYVSGEGEKKIVDYIRNTNELKNNVNSKIGIFSPDSDVTLLGLLLNTEFNKIDTQKIYNVIIIRNNQQKGDFDIINCDILGDNLYKYVVNKVRNTGNKLIMHRDNIVKDIVFLFTIFGNDFIPKIISYNVKYDFDRIIDKYIEALLFNVIKEKGNITEFNYLIDTNFVKKKQVIDFSLFINVLQRLQLDEGGNLQKIYMISNYKNYQRLCQKFNSTEENLTSTIYHFLQILRDVHNDINNGDKTIDIIKKYINIDNGDWVKILENITKDRSDFASYIEKYRKGNQPELYITFQEYTKSLDDKYHKNRLTEMVHNIDQREPITKYDKELYKFRNMLDDYRDKLDSGSLQLGRIEINSSTYKIESEKIEKGVARYYKEFFDIDDINDSHKMNPILDTYIEGLIWTFEFYYNRFDQNFSNEMADTWYYKYTKAPLLTQLYTYMKNKSINDKEYLTSISENLDKYYVNRSSYFNPLEQFIFVSPILSFLNLVPNEMKHVLVKMGKGNITKIKEIAKKVLSGERGIINCRGAIFLNKCEFGVPNTTWSEDTEFINSLRTVALSGNGLERTGEFGKEVIIVNFPNKVSLSTI